MRFYIYPKGIPERELNIQQRNNNNQRNEKIPFSLIKNNLESFHLAEQIQTRLWR